MRLSVMIFITNIFEANFPECITLEASLIVADFIISVYSASCNDLLLGLFLATLRSPSGYIIPKTGRNARK